MYKGWIYKWENKINGKAYIGQTMNRYGYKERWSQHRYWANKHTYDSKFHHAIRKYGIDGFHKEVLETIEDKNKEKLKQTLDKLEISYIEQYNSFNKGYNSTLGGDFNIWSSGLGADVEKANLRRKETMAYNQIKNATMIKTKYKLPSTLDDLMCLYKDMDIRFKKYRYEYKLVVKGRSEMHNKDYSHDYISKTKRHDVKIYYFETMTEDEIISYLDNDNYIDIPNDLDMMDKDIVKSLISIDINKLKYKYDYEIIDIFKWFDKFIREVKFTDRQREVLGLAQQGLRQTEIAKILNVSRSSINSILESVVNRIIKEYEVVYEDLYYLDIAKGTYKKCSKCGEIKLIQCFNKELKGKDGYKSKCKKCK